MLRIRDFITGDLSDSPADRFAAPFVFALAWPIIVPGTIIYHSAKGIKTLKENIEEKKYYEEMEKLERSSSVEQMPVDNKGLNKPKKLILKRDNKKM